jgi:hypothetical protein
MIKKHQGLCLIVSDHQHLREGLCLSLRMQQYHVVGTGDAIHAFTVIEEKIEGGELVGCVFLGQNIKFMTQVEFILFCRSKYGPTVVPILAQSPEGTELENSLSKVSLSEAGANVILRRNDPPYILKKIQDFSLEEAGGS